MEKLFYTLIVAILFLLVACTNYNGSNIETKNKVVSSKENSVVEKQKTENDNRLKGIIMNYWDKYDFCDTTSSNRANGEQLFSNFLMFLHYADSIDASKAIEKYINKWYTNSELRNRYMTLIKHYLENPESPMRNDVVYAHFLRSQLSLVDSNNEVLRSRIEFKLKLVNKNLTGSIASDFKYIDRKGNVSTLHSIKSDLTLIVFNDPECDNCRKIIPQLISDPIMKHEKLKVLMIYPDENSDAWKAHNGNIPNNWIDAYSPEGEIVNKIIYHIPAMPSLYLLDSEKRIILKDATPKLVSSLINKIIK